MNHRTVFLNALTTSLQVIASAAILFYLYRFLIRSIGMERLGIWSLVLATTSIVALAHQGFSTSIIKFVAKYSALEDHAHVSLLIQTAAISAAFLTALIAGGLYPAARWVLALVVPRANLAEAIAILPFALLSLWCNIIQGILQAGLAGHQWIALCNYLELAGSLAYLLLAIALVPGQGLLGLAFAQALQGAAFVALTWLVLRHKLPQLPAFPYRWNRALFRAIAGYGFHFQLITASQSLREPITKALITKFGGLAMTGFYDLASRFVVTARELLVQANQVLVPAVAHLQERVPESLPAVYRESYRVLFFLAVPAFSVLALVSPLVSRIWIGRYEPLFVEFVAILALAWLVNVLANPAYVVDLGTGVLRPVTIGCAATAVFNAVFGLIAGHFIGGVAVVGVSALSLACGYIFILAEFHLKRGMSFIVLLPAESRALFGCCAACIVFSILLFLSVNLNSVSSSIVLAAPAASLLLLVVPAWRHPLRKRLIRWAFRRPVSAHAEAA